MNPLLRIALIAAGATLLLVVALHLSRGGVATGWDALAAAQDPSPTVESLERARDIGGNTDAGPWIDYQLAIVLFDRGQPGDLDRAMQLADEVLRQHPDHVVATPLRRLVEAAGSYRQSAGG